ncbi:MAG: hypothetical protein RLZZ450_1881 [Pseudomonadota bacterium]
MRRWSERGSIRCLAREQERLLPNVLDIIAASAGSLNFNDALLVPLQREGSISEVASFDGGFDVLPTFVRVTDL